MIAGLTSGLIPFLSSRPSCSCRSPLARRRGRGDQAELLEHQEPVEHQVERDVLAVAEAQHLDVVEADGAAGWWDVAGRGVEDAVVGPGERAFLDGDVVDEVHVVDLDVRVGEGAEASRRRTRRSPAFPRPRIPPGAWKTTSSASTSANPSMSWALKVSVPLSNASRVVMVMDSSLRSVNVQAEGSRGRLVVR